MKGLILLAITLVGLSTQAMAMEKVIDGPTTISEMAGAHFDSLSQAQSGAERVGLQTATFHVEFFGADLCQRSSQGIFLGRIYDADIVRLNNVVVGQTGSPSMDSPRLTQKQRLYRIPEGLIRCDANVLTLEVTRTIGRRIGPVGQIITGHYHELEHRKYLLEAASLIQRDLGIILIALSLVLFIIFRKKEESAKYMEASAMLLAFGAYGITLSGWIYELVPWPDTVYRINAALVTIALAFFIRFRLAAGWKTVKLGDTALMFAGISALALAAIFLISDPKILFASYRLMLAIGIGAAAIIHFADIKRMWKVEWVLSTLILAAMTSDVLRIWMLHTLPNLSVYVNGVVGFALTLHYSGRLVPIFQRALKAKELEGELAAQRAIVRASQMIAHDVRKPFSMLKAVLQMLEASHTHEETKELIRHVAPEIDHSIHSVNGFLEDLMQVGAAPKLNLAQVSAVQIVDISVKEALNIEAHPELKLDLDVDSSLELSVDLFRLKRVFVNIISNAVQAMSAKGTIEIRARKLEDNCVFEILNTNSYIAPENIPNLFDSFYTSGKAGGTGLGLAIAKKWVEAHGGGISCYSERSGNAPSGLVRFTFTIPLA